MERVLREWKTADGDPEDMEAFKLKKMDGRFLFSQFGMGQKLRQKASGKDLILAIGEHACNA